jgi:hypothetical protein
VGGCNLAPLIFGQTRQRGKQERRHEAGHRHGYPDRATHGSVVSHRLDAGKEPVSADSGLVGETDFDCGMDGL